MPKLKELILGIFLLVQPVCISDSGWKFAGFTVEILARLAGAARENARPSHYGLSSAGQTRTFSYVFVRFRTKTLPPFADFVVYQGVPLVRRQGRTSGETKSPTSPNPSTVLRVDPE